MQNPRYNIFYLLKCIKLIFVFLSKPMIYYISMAKIKVFNTGRDSLGNPSLLGAGGVVRDVNGRWLGGCSHNVGISSVVIAEL